MTHGILIAAGHLGVDPPAVHERTAVVDLLPNARRGGAVDGGGSGECVS
jgi:hypothetical protein